MRDLNGSRFGARVEKSAGGVSTAECLRRSGVDLAERGVPLEVVVVVEGDGRVSDGDARADEMRKLLPAMMVVVGW